MSNSEQRVRGKLKSLSLSNIELKYFCFQHLNFSSSTKCSCKFSYWTYIFTIYINLCLEFTLNNFFQICITHGSLALCLSWSLSNALYPADSAASPVSLLLLLPAGTQLCGSLFSHLRLPAGNAAARDCETPLVLHV